LRPCTQELLIDGILYAFQEQTGDDHDIMLSGFGTIVNALGKRSKPYLPQICGTIKWYGGFENKHSTDVEWLFSPQRVCMSSHP
jgi:hypothetical protein